MKKLSRLFMLCVMFVAIPLQGFAAADSLDCRTLHHHAFPGEKHNHEDVQIGQHDCQHINAKKSSNHAVAKATVVKSMKDKCSACASCCVGAGLVTNSVIPPVFVPSSEGISLAFFSQPSHISDGLERPPRT